VRLVCAVRFRHSTVISVTWQVSAFLFRWHTMRNAQAMRKQCVCQLQALCAFDATMRPCVVVLAAARLATHDALMQTSAALKQSDKMCTELRQQLQVARSAAAAKASKAGDSDDPPSPCPSAPPDLARAIDGSPRTQPLTGGGAPVSPLQAATPGRKGNGGSKLGRGPQVSQEPARAMSFVIDSLDNVAGSQGMVLQLLAALERRLGTLQSDLHASAGCAVGPTVALSSAHASHERGALLEGAVLGSFVRGGTCLQHRQVPRSRRGH
jgi:hypothetical protein